MSCTVVFIDLFEHLRMFTFLLLHCALIKTLFDLSTVDHSLKSPYRCRLRSVEGREQDPTFAPDQRPVVP